MSVAEEFRPTPRVRVAAVTMGVIVFSSLVAILLIKPWSWWTVASSVAALAFGALGAWVGSLQVIMNTEKITLRHGPFERSLEWSAVVRLRLKRRGNGGFNDMGDYWLCLDGQAKNLRISAQGLRSMDVRRLRETIADRTHLAWAWENR